MAGTTWARLWTKTGCLSCRRRQKKCDEWKPVCSGCARNGLACSWPKASQMLDRRSRRYQAQLQQAELSSVDRNDQVAQEEDVRALATVGGTSSSSSSESPSNGNSNPDLPGTMLSAFEFPDEYELFKYFAYSVLPSLIQPGSWKNYSDQTYMIAMGLAFPPLKSLMVALALMRLPTSGSRNNSFRAVRHYLSSISSLREVVAQGNLTGTEDHLLAMTMCFCLFENSRMDGLLQTRMHVKSFAALFKLRTPKPALSSRQILLFDRTAVESFVYHATLLMLFNPSTDCFQDQWLSDKISHYFTDHSDMDELPGSPSAAHPVLGASYKFFFFIADVTRLATLGGPASEQSQALLAKLQLDLRRWEELHRQRVDENIQTPLGELYLLAVRILLLQSREQHYDLDPGLAHDLASCYHLGLKLVSELQVNPFFTGLYIWPLAVLGSMALRQEDAAVFEKRIQALRRDGGQNGLTAWVLQRLHHIWTQDEQYMCSSESHAGMMKGLRMLIRRE